MDLSGKSILMFCPSFFNYEIEIKNTLEGFGATVVLYDDRPSNNFFSKALIRINKKILSRKIQNYYNKIIEEVLDQKIDYIFFVNPEAISKPTLSRLKNIFPGAKAILYMWDSFQNRKQNIELLPLFDSKFTFDPNDAQHHNLQFRPLFFSEIYKRNQTIKKDFDLLFIGTAHSDRYTFVKRLTKMLSKHKVKLYFYLSSKALFFIKKLADKQFKGVNYNDISFRSLSHNDISSLMRRSAAILDINHPGQIGLTMRTIEALGSQCKLITTNQDVLKYDFYDPNNILLIDRKDPIIDSSFLASPFVVPDQRILFKYSIQGFLTEIFQVV